MDNDWMETVLNSIRMERERQTDLIKIGKFHWDCSHVGPTDEAKLSVLAEEFGEAARLVTESIIDRSRRDMPELYKELVQVAAVATAWCEALKTEMYWGDDEKALNMVARPQPKPVPRPPPPQSLPDIK